MESEFREKINLASKPLLTFPKTPNYKTCGDYLISRNETKENGSRAFIREGHIVRNASIANHLSKKQLFQTEQRLRQIKHISSERREALDAQWKDLAEKEEQFRENFIYFDKFIHENIEKRKRSVIKISSMNQTYLHRVDQIEKLQYQRSCMKELKHYLDDSITRHHIYEDFLYDVVKSFPHLFTSIMDILTRYDALKHAGDNLIELRENQMNTFVRARAKLDTFVEEKYFEIAGLKAKLSDYEKHYERARLHCQKWEKIHHEVIMETLNKFMEVEAVKDSCWQIYKDICDRKKAPTIYKDNYPKQFEVIKKTLLQHRLVNEKIAVLEEEKLRLSEKACASNGTG